MVKKQGVPLLACVTSDGLRTSLGSVSSFTDAELNQLSGPSGRDFGCFCLFFLSLLVLR